MCGICGIYNFASGEPADRALLERMNAVQHHRGPDDDGYLVEGPIGLAMRRLSIIDLAGGRQPIGNEDGSVWIVFNGEIYNFQELRHELLAKGHRFATRSDTEVIVHSYEEWGDDCVGRLNGIFGFAIWDARRRRLLLARDHFGVKPLYYFEDGQRLLWGSELKPLLADPAIPRAVDLEALNLFLTYRFVPSPLTLFQGLRKLGPGHRLICERGACRVERYWCPRPQPGPARSEHDYVELLQQRLEAAVRRQMISDVPVGALLSGGVDSAAVVAIMSQLTNHPLQTFTVGFKDGDEVNELAEARETARLFGTQHHEIVLERLDYQHWLQKVIWHLEEPISTTSALPMYAVCQRARESVTVVLTGQGADEPHAGYHRYLGERYGGLYRRLPLPLRERAIRPLIEALPRQERIKRAVRSLSTTDVSERFVQAYAVFSAEMKTALWRPEQYARLDQRRAAAVVEAWRDGLDGLDGLTQMAYVDARLSLADDLLLYGDKMSMASSVEARVPFLDLEYMAVAEALPPGLRIHGATRKYLHKKAVAKWLPRSLIDRPKRGFETPIDRWFRSELSGYVRETLLAPDAACRSYFKPEAVSRAIRDHVSGRQDNRRQLFSLLVFEIWHRTFISRRSQEPYEDR